MRKFIIAIAILANLNIDLKSQVLDSLELAKIESQIEEYFRSDLNEYRTIYNDNLKEENKILIMDSTNPVLYKTAGMTCDFLIEIDSVFTKRNWISEQESRDVAHSFFSTTGYKIIFKELKCQTSAENISLGILHETSDLNLDKLHAFSKRILFGFRTSPDHDRAQMDKIYDTFNCKMKIKIRKDKSIYYVLTVHFTTLKKQLSLSDYY